MVFMGGLEGGVEEGFFFFVEVVGKFGCGEFLGS